MQAAAYMLKLGILANTAATADENVKKQKF